MSQDEKFRRQDSLYSFPYHYIPTLDDGGSVRIHRHLSWGMEYLTYMSSIVDTIQKLRPNSLCDVGCGDGRLIHMVKSFVPNVTGIDLSKRAIAFAKAFNPDAEFICGDIANLSRRYDVVTLVEVLEHISDDLLTPFLANVARLSIPEGRLLITVPTLNVSLNRKHYRHYDLPTLELTLAPYFKIEQAWWLYRIGLRKRLVETLISNRLFLLNSGFIMRFVWKWHKRFGYDADAHTGAHLACVARPVAAGIGE